MKVRIDCLVSLSITLKRLGRCYLKQGYLLDELVIWENGRDNGIALWMYTFKHRQHLCKARKTRLNGKIHE
jgi:hypothetical protein